MGEEEREVYDNHVIRPRGANLKKSSELKRK